MRLRFGLALAALALMASPARAWDLAVGVKWLPVNYTTPVSASVNGLNGGVTPLSGWNTTSINNYAGAFILDGRLGFTLGLDLGYSSCSGVGCVRNTLTQNLNLSFVQFGLAIGSKYYLLKPRGGHVAPYVLFDFFKYFAVVSTDSGAAKGTEEILGGLASPLGVDAAVGVEYFFTRGFSLGAELLGLKYSYSSGSASLATSGFGGSMNATTTNQYVTFYTGISLNYRFQIQNWKHVPEGSTAAEEEPTEQLPVKRPKNLAPEKPQSETPPPPPREPPPTEPESVD
jgi:hypothetical protein